MDCRRAKHIRGLSVRDIRFPTSLEADGSDATHFDPDYSCAYVVLFTEKELKGYGFTFTIGKGTEIVVAAVKALSSKIVGKELDEIFGDMAGFCRELTNDSQLRWIGPEKGVIHLACAAIMNAVWDLWARQEHKPLWKLLTDMEPEKLVSTIDFSYISDAITKEEAIELLKKNEATKNTREKEILHLGYPAYCTSVGWLGYPDDKIEKRCKEALAKGFTSFKVKVGADLNDDLRRLSLVRSKIGHNCKLMVDANQKWDVQQAINWMKKLAPFQPIWIEEPTSPDDILGHATIAKELNPLGIGVATGEQCHNRVMFKQFLQARAMQFCQIDCCRLAGVSEVLAVYLMAAKFGVPVCPHAGGVGLCELVQHVAVWDYICCSGSLDNRMIEYVDHLHEHFFHPVEIRSAHYIPPKASGYSSEMKETTLFAYEYPTGSKWQEMFQQGKFKQAGVPLWIENQCFN